ncbi:hypothetical protein VB711_19410 [Cronbergia sp. UHCC 0137]|uniref:hypothetical protein n=1 Tax=Cronbergia sp. UHCC 0137 TaxID=3110239 RepID=UPI002B1F7A88|nr:hypothetical protein [Cronbergia sp. UHCC 0137]MEA5619995.1 hypothetical protein [Cronbergia sp. UHCC 0137]
MSDIAILKEMIQKNATVPLEDDLDRRNKVILKEPKPPNYYVTIRGMPDDDNVIIINADEFKSPDTIFNGKRGECKRADFIIIADTDNKKVIICIEMKAGKGGTMKDITAQLQGAKCFVAYCREIGQSFWDHPNFLQDYKLRFISITKITQKTTTRFDRERIYANQNLASKL